MGLRSDFCKSLEIRNRRGKSTPQIPNFKVSCPASFKNAIFKHISWAPNNEGETRAPILRYTGFRTRRGA